MSLGSANKCRFSPPDGVSGENKLSIQKECSRFPTSDSSQLLVYFQLRNYKLIRHFRTFSFWLGFSYWSSFWRFWTPKSWFQHFRHPKGTFLRQTMSFELSYVKIRCELWSVGELTKQEDEEEKSKKKPRIGTVYFTHMGAGEPLT